MVRRIPGSRRTRLVALGAAVALVATFTVVWSQRQSTVTVPLSWFYRPPANASAEDLAAAVERYVLTSGDEGFRDELRALGEQGPFLLYVRSEAVMDDAGLGYTWQNQVAHRPGDFARLSSEHPDWFLLDDGGQRIRSGEGDLAETRFYLMDPGSPGWRAFFVERLRAMDDGWDGVFLDNVEASLLKRERGGALPAKYRTDAAWASAVRDFVGHVRTAYADPRGRLLEANVIDTRTTQSPAYEAALAPLDGVMREGWLDGEDVDWEGRVAEAERAQDLGKHVLLTANGAADDEQERRFALASFLLADRGRATFRWTSYATYDRWRGRAPYELDLGPATGEREQVDGVWRRAFARGTVSVDPVRRVGTIRER